MIPPLSKSRRYVIETGEARTSLERRAKYRRKIEWGNGTTVCREISVEGTVIEE